MVISEESTNGLRNIVVQFIINFLMQFLCADAWYYMEIDLICDVTILLC